MFGFSLKDAFGKPLYQEFDEFEELENMVNGMVAFARSQPPFDYMKAKTDAEASSKVRTEMVGPMLRVAGNDSLDSIKEYTKFVRFMYHALQISYYEMEVPDLGRVGQLTVVDNYRFPLEEELKLGFIDMFFEWQKNKDDIRMMETPGHVCVAIMKRG